MRVLVGCEESGTVRDAFAARGHDAWSNDLIPARSGGKHLQMCVKEAITQHGPWDIIILHPDCTAMTVAGNRWYSETLARRDAVIWTENLWILAKKYAIVGCAIENPVSVLWNALGKPQYVQPWQFGTKETKNTGILTDRLPPLEATNIVGPPPATGSDERKSWEVVWRMAKSPTRKRDRSKTNAGIAKAMAEQWG